MVLPLWLMRMAMTAVQQRAGSRPPDLVPPRPGGRLVCFWQHPPRVPRRGRMEDRCDRGSSNPCTARVVLLATANGLTASLHVFTWLDFRSRPQELQGRSKKADIEYVILAGTSFSPLWSACARGLGLSCRV